MAQTYGIAVAGDLGGSQRRAPLALRPVDRDDFEQVFAALQVWAPIGLPECEALDLTSFDHFDANAHLRRVPALERLGAARAALGRPERARALLAEAGGGIDLDAPQEAPAPSQAPAPAAASDGDLLDAMLSGAGADAPATPAPSSRRAPAPRAPDGDPAFARFVRELSNAASEALDRPTRERYTRVIDAERARRLGALLASPGLRELEAVWRPLRDLVFGCDSGASVRLWLADGERAQLLGGPALGDAVRALRDEPGALAPDLIVWAHAVDDPDELCALAELGARCGVPVVAGTAHDELELGAVSAGRERLGVCWPRLLAREPWSPAGVPVEELAFDESERDDFEPLWASSAFALARCAALAATEYGSAAEAARCARLDGQRVCHVSRDGRPVQLGPTERILTDAELEACVGRGLAVVAGERNGDAVRVASFRSLGGAPLLGS